MPSDFFVMPTMAPAVQSAIKYQNHPNSAVAGCLNNSEAVGQGRNFLSTLRQISAEKKNADAASMTNKNGRAFSGDADSDMAISAEANKELNDLPITLFQALVADRLLTFRQGLMGDQINHNGLDSESGSHPTHLAELFEHLQLKGQGLLIDRLAGLIQVDNLVADISLENTTAYYLKELMAQAALDPDADGKMDAGLFKLWRWGAEVSNADSVVQIGTMLTNAKAILTTDAINPDQDILVKLKANDQTKASISFENIKGANLAEGLRVSAAALNDYQLDTGQDFQTNKSDKASQRFNFKAGAVTVLQDAGQNLTGEEIISKRFEIVPTGKAVNPEAQLQLGRGLGNKVVHIEADHKDSGLLYTQGQTADQITKPETLTSEAEITARTFQSQALNQIVQRAVLHLKNGQNEVKIDLKPEFLGHIRMQIISESHQVVVKILAEFPFVKDMLENNLQQLKAELQAQGLDVEELEVSVAHDSDQYNNRQQKTADIKKANPAEHKNPNDHVTPQEKIAPSHSAAGRGKAAGIDYFV